MEGLYLMARIITKKEYKKRRLRFQVAAGFFDFLVVLACGIAALACFFLLTELYTWLKGDVPVTFGKFISIAERAMRMN